MRQNATWRFFGLTYREILLVLAQAFRYYISPHRYLPCNLHFPLRRRVRASVFTHYGSRHGSLIGTIRRTLQASEHLIERLSHQTHLRYSICVINNRRARSTRHNDNWRHAAITIIASMIILFVIVWSRELLYYNTCADYQYDCRCAHQVSSHKNIYISIYIVYIYFINFINFFINFRLVQKKLACHAKGSEFKPINLILSNKKINYTEINRYFKENHNK